MYERVAGWIAISGAVYHAGVLVSMHILEPEFDPIRAPGSAYVTGAHGAWMSSTYFVLAAALLAAAHGAVRTQGNPRLARAARLVFTVAAAATCVAGIFPMDWPGPLRTASGRLHAIGGGVAFPCFTAGAILLSLSLRRRERRTTLARAALALSGALAAAVILGIASMILLGFAGYAQRVFFAIFYTWLILTGRYFTRLGGGEAGSAGPR